MAGRACDTAPVYVVSPAPAAGIEIAARSSRPSGVAPGGRQDGHRERWSLAAGDDRLKKPTRGACRTRPGEFALAAVTDPERGGACN